MSVVHSIGTSFYIFALSRLLYRMYISTWHCETALWDVGGRHVCELDVCFRVPYSNVKYLHM